MKILFPECFYANNFCYTKAHKYNQSCLDLNLQPRGKWHTHYVNILLLDISCHFFTQILYTNLMTTVFLSWFRVWHWKGTIRWVWKAYESKPCIMSIAVLISTFLFSVANSVECTKMLCISASLTHSPWLRSSWN